MTEPRPTADPLVDARENSSEQAVYALVAVPVPLGRAFSYRVPENLAADVSPGARVLVDFGGRRVVGVVLETTTEPPAVDPTKIKPIAALVDSEPVLPTSLLSFLRELGRYYMAPIGEVMRLALPAVERSDRKRLASDELRGTKLGSVGKLVRIVASIAESELGSDARQAELSLRGQAKGILAALRAGEPLPFSSLVKDHPNARAAVRRLTDLGLVTVHESQDFGADFFSSPATPDAPPSLNTDQEAAVAAIVSRLSEGRGGAFLLQGVTASGKTEVYLRTVARALELGGAVIVLVPEISLTPQLVARFRARLGDQIAVLHSGLSERERHLMWKRLRTRELRVAIGARSALFAPLEGINLVCVDEEHDASFKQEEGVRYHARDMAILRAHRAGAVCILGSATPSLVTLGLVEEGRVTRLRLRERAQSGARLPKVEVIDLKRTGPGPSGDRLITIPLFRALEEVLGRGEQSILFLNRRGFAPSLVCDACGQISQCPNCSVPLTVHRTPKPRVLCHHCDFSRPLAETCPACGARSLVEEGAGTERIERSLKELFPKARVARLDRDVAAGLKSQAVLERMRRGEIDILVGTQMVTKGHDLPQVTLVGVLNADAGLSMPDFQAAERSFQLLVQVAGRAGRADQPGRVLVQTRNPKHPAIQFATRHDVDAFVEHALEERRELRYPPYSRIALVRVDATDEHLSAQTARDLAQVARQAGEKSASPSEILGPAPAPIAKVRNRFRHRFMLRAMNRKDLREALIAVARAPHDRRVRVSLDVDPVNML